MNNQLIRRGGLAAGLSGLMLIAGCGFGLWTLYPSADVQLPWAADYDQSEQAFLVSDLHASQVKVLTPQGTLLASMPFSTMPNGSYVDEITRRTGNDHDWWALNGDGELLRFVYQPASNTLVMSPSGPNWLGPNVWAVCDIASGDYGDLFVAYIELTRSGSRTVILRTNATKPKVSLVVQTSPSGLCGHLDHDAILREIVYYDPTNANFIRVDDDLSQVNGTAGLPPNSNSAVHDFVSEGGYLFIAHVKVLGGLTQNYVTMQNPTGAVQDSMLFQSVFELVLEEPVNYAAGLMIFGQQSNANMHRIRIH